LPELPRNEIWGLSIFKHQQSSEYTGTLLSLCSFFSPLLFLSPSPCDPAVYFKSTSLKWARLSLHPAIPPSSFPCPQWQVIVAGLELSFLPVSLKNNKKF